MRESKGNDTRILGILPIFLGTDYSKRVWQAATSAEHIIPGLGLRM